ncbi:hypothetical protein N2152v2_001004 [Parachlorella kessleri]
MCGAVNYAVILADPKYLLHPGPGNCRYAADALSCCAQCGANKQCAAWFFTTVPGLDCDSGDAACKSTQQAPDSCGPSSCSLYSGYYKVDNGNSTSFFSYGLTAGAYKGRSNGGSLDKPDAAPDPAAEKGMTVCLAFDYQDNTATAINRPCELFADSVEDCVEACNSQRYAAQAIGSGGGCLAYSFNAAEKSSCFGGARDEDGKIIAKAGECLLFTRVSKARARADNDTKLTYGAIDASAIPALPSPCPAADLRWRLQFKLVINGPDCPSLLSYKKVLRTAVAASAGVLATTVDLTCQEGSKPSAAATARPTCSAAKRTAGAAGSASSCQQLQVQVLLGPFTPTEGASAQQKLKAATKGGGLKTALAGVLPSAQFTLSQLPLQGEVTCQDGAGKAC